MTAAFLTRLPFEAGGAVLASTGRAAGSAFLTALSWSVSRYMRAPLANTGIAAMLGFGLLASSNALFLQTHRHPAPLFAPMTQTAEVPKVRPVVPAVRQNKPVLKAVPKVEAVVDASKPIGNTEVFELQRKLEALKFFEGTVDGYYGPKTARAIRAFEEHNGLKPTGQLTPETLKTILAAPISSVAPVAKPLPTPEPLPEVKPLAQIVVTQPVAEAPAIVATLKAPEPLEIGVTAKIAPMQPVADTQPLTRELPETPQEAMDIAVDTAGDAIETIINGVQTLAQTTTGKKAPTPFLFGPVDQATPAPMLVKAEIEPVVTAKADVGGDAVIKPLPVAELDTEAKIEDLMPAFSVTDPIIVSQVQRRLAALGFLHGPIDGRAGEATAKAIRAFETFYNYQRTGRITPELPDLLVKAGAPL